MILLSFNFFLSVASLIEPTYSRSIIFEGPTPIKLNNSILIFQVKKSFFRFGQIASGQVKIERSLAESTFRKETKLIFAAVHKRGKAH